MAKQIKVLKCPQCGNTKPSAIGNEHYRCDKCNTEFFLDNDDINVNVNHTYGQTYRTPSSGSSSDLSILKKIIVSFVTIFLILSISVIGIIYSQAKKDRRKQTTTQTAQQHPKSDKYPLLCSTQGKAVVFYIEKRNHLISTSNAKNGYFAVFYDLVAGKTIKEEKIPMDKNIGDQIEYRYFTSDNKHYLILNNESLYRIEPDGYLLQNIAKEISESKPALNAGFSSISFVPAGEGDGFLLQTNLGKEFYYFPHPDMLCTPRAFKHIAEGGFATALPTAKDTCYYLFYNKESKESSNVAELLRINYKFNNGGPECRMQEIKQQNATQPEKYRIRSIVPVTKERICFSPEVLYFDNQQILITYRTTLAQDAPTRIELLNVSGEVVWSAAFDKPIHPKYAIKTADGFMVQTIYDQFYAIKSDGQENLLYTLK